PDLGEEVDLKSLDAPAQLGHGVRGEGAVDAGAERRQLVLSEHGAGIEERGQREGGEASEGHREPPGRLERGGHVAPILSEAAGQVKPGGRRYTGRPGGPP